MNFDPYKIREQFPILKTEPYGKTMVYFDNGATTQKPIKVMQAMEMVFNEINGNPHRGAHYFANKTTVAYEDARDKVQAYIHAPKREEIIFTKGATESLNLIAYSFGEAFLNEGDEILITGMEHHANIVPWQLIAERKKAKVKHIPINKKGELELENIDTLLTEKTKLVSLTMVSNVLGTVNPIEKIIELAHKKGIPVCIDAAQAIQHLPINVHDLDCDFMVFSGHKMYGPTGVGVLYGKSEWLNQLPPFMGGGEMIEKVTLEKTTFNQLPYKFEAGTPNYAEVIGLGAAIDFITETGLQEIAKYEHDLFEYAHDKLSKIEGIKFIGNADRKTSVISFLINDIHPYDMGMFLDKMGFSLRTGHHCAEPVIDFFGIPGTVRLSLAMYNTRDEIDALVAALEKIKMMF